MKRYLVLLAVLPALVSHASARPVETTRAGSTEANVEPAAAPDSDAANTPLPRLIIVTESSSQVFSGTFKGQSTTESETTEAPPLQLQYAGPTTGIQVFTYNESAINSPLRDLTQVQWSPFDDNKALTAEEASIQKGRAFCRQLLVENPNLQLCEPDQTVKLSAGASYPQDPLLKQQWALSAINAAGAWSRSAYGSKNVRVCMVDTGFDYYHPDLAPNVWKNPKEIPDNGIDDDKNGIVDDVHGANFVKGTVSGDPYDDNGHGTFVAGVVGAVGNNNIGISGISQESSIIGCKFMDATGNGLISDAIRCFDYCAKQDAHIISNSWGVYSTSPALQQAATALNSRGILIVASSGNNAKDTDQAAHVPSTLTTPNLIAVGALQSDGKVWPGSNSGLKTVHFMAPGARVLGLAVGGSYVTMTGTSMAAPHVAGVAALVLSKFLNKGFPITTKYPSVGLAAQMKNALILSSYKLPGTKVSLYGGVNATQAIQLVPNANTRKVLTKTESEIAAEGETISATPGPPLTAKVEAPAPAPESEESGGCDCSCYAPASAPAATSADLPPGLVISSTGTVVAVSPALAQAGTPESAPMPSRKNMASRPE